jgi:FixJ family two-component response regulator
MSAATFSSGEAYLASLHKDKAAQSDCVLIDAQMPGMSGLDVQEQLAREGLGIPIVFITAHDSTEVRDQALSRGAFAFLRKPIGRDLLLQTIRAALRWRRDAAEGRP